MINNKILSPSVIESKFLKLNFGPQHPTAHGVLSLLVPVKSRSYTLKKRNFTTVANSSQITKLVRVRLNILDFEECKRVDMIKPGTIKKDYNFFVPASFMYSVIWKYNSHMSRESLTKFDEFVFYLSWESKPKTFESAQQLFYKNSKRIYYFGGFIRIDVHTYKSNKRFIIYMDTYPNNPLVKEFFFHSQRKALKSDNPYSIKKRIPITISCDVAQMLKNIQQSISLMELDEKHQSIIDSLDNKIAFLESNSNRRTMLSGSAVAQILRIIQRNIDWSRGEATDPVYESVDQLFDNKAELVELGLPSVSVRLNILESTEVSDAIFREPGKFVKEYVVKLPYFFAHRLFSNFSSILPYPSRAFDEFSNLVIYFKKPDTIESNLETAKTLFNSFDFENPNSNDILRIDAHYDPDWVLGHILYIRPEWLHSNTDKFNLLENFMFYQEVKF